MSTPAPDAGAVHVWLAPESLADDAETAAGFLALLSDDERVRHARFRADTPRRLHLVARGLQRRVLSRYEPRVAPGDWRFSIGPTGRPEPAPELATDLDFNLAHTRGLVAMAVARGTRVGIDVENHGRRRPLELARRYFSDREITALEALPPAAQPQRFLELWTLKEAYLKAIGTGVAGGLGTMTFEWRDGDIAFERAADPRAANWRFRQRDIGKEHLLAVTWLAQGTGERDVTWHELTPEILQSCRT